MIIQTYIALVHQDGDSNFGINSPDFPGCISAADTLTEVIRMREEALAFHAEGMQIDGENLPSPRWLSEIKADPDWAESLNGAIFAAVDLHVVREAAE